MVNPLNIKWRINKNIRIAIYLNKRHGGTYVYLRSNGELIGTAALQPKKINSEKYVEITSLYVKEPYRNKGIGSIVLKEILQFVKERGFKGILGHIMHADSLENIKRRSNFYLKNNAEIKLKGYKKTFKGERVPILQFILT